MNDTSVLRCARCRTLYAFRIEHRRCPRCRHTESTLYLASDAEAAEILASEAETPRTDEQTDASGSPVGPERLPRHCFIADLPSDD